MSNESESESKSVLDATASKELNSFMEYMVMVVPLLTELVRHVNLEDIHHELSEVLVAHVDEGGRHELSYAARRTLRMIEVMQEADRVLFMSDEEL